MGDAPGRDPIEHSQALGGQLLPHLAGAAQAVGKGAAGGRADRPCKQLSARKVHHLLQALGLTGID